MEEYRESLEKIGATVFLVPTGEDISCVQKSQLIRLLAHYFPFIHDNDIIVTADVDAFVMTEDLYKPLTLDRVSLKLFILILLGNTWLFNVLTFIIWLKSFEVELTLP